jgi:putative membrane protein
MHKHTLLPLVVALALIVTAPARAGEPPKEGAAPGGADVKFVNNAARDGEAEVILGKLAAEKGTAEEVKKFGQQMVDDHSKANEELKGIAKSKQTDLEKAQAAGTKKGERISQKLNKLEGAEFDKGYVAVMVKEHEAAVKLFEGQSKNGQDEELKAFAAKTLPTLQHHLEMVKELQSKVGRPQGGAGGGGAAKKEGGSEGGEKKGDAEVKTRE